MSATARGVWAAQAGHLQVGGKQNAVGTVLNASKPIKTQVARKVARRARREARARVQYRQQRVLAGGGGACRSTWASGGGESGGGAHLKKKLSPRCRMIMVAASTPCCAWSALLRWPSAQRRPARGKGVSDRQHAEEASATDRCRAGVLTRARVCGRATQGTSAGERSLERTGRPFGL